MNSDFSKLTKDEREQRLTALLLGELSLEEAESIRQAIAADAELAREHERLKQTIELVRETGAMERKVSSDGTPLKLDDERRKKLLETFKTPAPRPRANKLRRWRKHWFVPMSAAAALVGLLTLMMGWPQMRSYKMAHVTRLPAYKGVFAGESAGQDYQIAADSFATAMRDAQKELQLGQNGSVVTRSGLPIVDGRFQVSGQLSVGASGYAAPAEKPAQPSPKAPQALTVVLPAATEGDEGRIQLGGQFLASTDPGAKRGDPSSLNAYSDGSASSIVTTKAAEAPASVDYVFSAGNNGELAGLQREDVRLARKMEIDRKASGASTPSVAPGSAPPVGPLVVNEVTAQPALTVNYAVESLETALPATVSFATDSFAFSLAGAASAPAALPPAATTPATPLAGDARSKLNRDDWAQAGQFVAPGDPFRSVNGLAEEAESKKGANATPDAPAGSALVTRHFQVDPKKLEAGVQNVTAFGFGEPQQGLGGGGGGRAPAEAAGGAGGRQFLTEATPAATTPPAIQEFLTTLGVDLTTPGKAVAYNERSGTLMVRGTQSDVETAEKAMQVLNTPTPSATVTTTSGREAKAQAPELDYDRAVRSKDLAKIYSEDESKKVANPVPATSESQPVLTPSFTVSAAARSAPTTDSAPAQSQNGQRFDTLAAAEPNRGDAAKFVQDGKLFYESGRLSEAEEALRQAAKLDPENQGAKYYEDLVSARRLAAEARLREVNSKALLMDVEREWTKPQSILSGDRNAYGASLPNAGDAGGPINPGEKGAATPVHRFDASFVDSFETNGIQSLAQAEKVLRLGESQQGRGGGGRGGGRGGVAGGFGNVAGGPAAGTGGATYAGVSTPPDGSRSPTQRDFGVEVKPSAPAGNFIGSLIDDDGMATHVNGIEVTRTNGPAGSVSFSFSAGSLTFTNAVAARSTEWFDSDALATAPQLGDAPVIGGLFGRTGIGGVGGAGFGGGGFGADAGGSRTAFGSRLNSAVSGAVSRSGGAQEPQSGPASNRWGDFDGDGFLGMLDKAAKNPQIVKGMDWNGASADQKLNENRNSQEWDAAHEEVFGAKPRVVDGTVRGFDDSTFDTTTRRDSGQPVTLGNGRVAVQLPESAAEGQSDRGRGPTRAEAEKESLAERSGRPVGATTFQNIAVDSLADAETKERLAKLGDQTKAGGVAPGRFSFSGNPFRPPGNNGEPIAFKVGSLISDDSAVAAMSFSNGVPDPGTVSFSWKVSAGSNSTVPPGLAYQWGKAPSATDTVRFQIAGESERAALQNDSGLALSMPNAYARTNLAAARNTVTVGAMDQARGAVIVTNGVFTINGTPTAQTGSEKLAQLPQAQLSPEGVKAVRQQQGLALNEPLPAKSEADLDHVLSVYAELTGKTLVKSPQLQTGKKISIQNQAQLSKEEKIDALNTVLGLNGITIVNEGETFVKAMPQSATPQAAVNFSTNSFDTSPPPVSQIVHLKNLTPEEAVSVLAPFSKLPNSIVSVKGSPVLVLRDHPENVKRMMEILDKVDVKGSDTPLPKPPPGAPIPQPEVLTRDNEFSTFSLNVSDVSFKLAAASLEKGAMPDAAGIRSEEFINAFDYRDPMPLPGAPLAFAWERARYPFAHHRDVVRFSIKTAAQGREGGKPLNIVLLLDNSGSMERADRVRIIQESLRTLAAQLKAQDKLSVVTFSRTASLRVDGVSGTNAAEVAKQVGALTPEGGTNLEDALDLAYRTALRHYAATAVNRVVLLTDGAANLGNVDPKALKAKVENYRKQGIALDCFGIGWEGFNDDLLEQLSRNGDGRYGFVNTPEEAASEFVGQLAGALQVAASDVKMQVEFNPRRVTAWRQIGYAKHQLTKQQFRDNKVDAAEIGASESGNALYVIETDPNGDGPIATVRARFRIPQTSDYREHEWTVPFGSAVELQQSSPSLRLASSASAFSEWLASSPFSGEVTTDRLLGTLAGVPETYGADPRPKRLEWMVRQAKSISGK